MSPSHAIRVILAFVRKELRIARSYRFALVLNAASIVMGVITFFFLGRLFEGRTPPQLASYQGGYFAFVLLGVAASTFLVSLLNGVSQAILQEQGNGTLEAILLAPLPTYLVFSGLVLWNVLFSFGITLGYMGLGLALGVPDEFIASFFRGSLILFAAFPFFLALGMASAALLLRFRRANPVTWILSSLSVFLGGVYFPVEILPAPLQAVAPFLPLTYVLRQLRQSALGSRSLTSTLIECIYLLFISCICIYISKLLLDQSLKSLRRSGSVGHL